MADIPNDWGVWFQDPATPVIESMFSLHNEIMFFLIIICMLVCGMLLQTVAYYAETTLCFNLPKANHVYNRSSAKKHNTFLELVWTIIPAGILLSIGIPSFALLYSMDEGLAPVLTLKVMGHQWYWSYQYSDPNNPQNDEFFPPHDAYMELFDHLPIVIPGYKTPQYRLLDTDHSVNLPINQHIRVIVTSTDVLHSWAVPSFGIKLDACPGRLNETSLFIKREGVFYGQCSEICGANHAFMPIRIIAKPVDHFFFQAEFNLRINELFNTHAERKAKKIYKLSQGKRFHPMIDEEPYYVAGWYSNKYKRRKLRFRVK